MFTVSSHTIKNLKYNLECAKDISKRSKNLLDSYELDLKNAKEVHEKNTKIVEELSKDLKLLESISNNLE